jgi:hypothetical protein
MSLVVYGRTSLLIVRILLSFLPQSRANLKMGYRTLNKFDGLGAQLQRVIAVRGLSNFLEIPLSQPPILDIATHPLDGFDNRLEFDKFLEKVNFLICSTDLESNYEVLDVDNLKFIDFFNCIWQTGLRGRKIHLLVTHPYKFVDAKPMIYKLALDEEVRNKIREFQSPAKCSGIALHHRQGVGGMSTQPGQAKPRELELSKYIPVIRRILQIGKIESLNIFTDAPAETLIFQIPDDQIDSWKGLPGITENLMSVQNQNFDIFSTLNVTIRIIRGGNPLLSLMEMSQSEFLILSHSSFGYVSAIFAGHKNVFIPKTFWHPPLKGWTKY